MQQRRRASGDFAAPAELGLCGDKPAHSKLGTRIAHDREQRLWLRAWAKSSGEKDWKGQAVNPPGCGFAVAKGGKAAIPAGG